MPCVTRKVSLLPFLVDEHAIHVLWRCSEYSEIDPISSNTTPEGRKQNRRTEITLQPNIDELVKVPE